MNRALTLFLLVTFGFSWSVSEIYYRIVGQSMLGGVVMPVLFMYGPAIGAVAAARFGLREPLRNLGPVWAWSPWLFVAWLGPMAFAIAHVVVALALPGVGLHTDSAAMGAAILAGVPEAHKALATSQLEALGDGLVGVLALQILVGGLAAGATINALAAFGEELGWRGFMQRLLPSWGFWRGCAAIGVIWGIWHLPLVVRGHNFPQHPELGVGLMVVFCVLLSPLFAHVRERAGSVLSASIMHGTLNATGGATVFLAGGSDLLTGPTGLAGLVVLAFLNLVLAWLRRGASAASASAALPTGAGVA